MELFLKYKKIIIIGGVVLTLSILSLIIYFNKTDKVLNTPISVNAEIVNEIKEETSKVFVDIKGEVNKPGMYMIESGKRVYDVIILAGGLSKNASTRSINLSKTVTDEMVIIVHSKNEIDNWLEVKEKQIEIACNCNEESYDVKNDGCIDNQSSNNSTLVSINTATIETLLTLPGIGEAKAKNIINYRNEIGTFTAIEDILNVSGIGESIFAQIKDYITL